MTKQNMPRLTESQLFTIEALNRIEGFVWPDGATGAAMDNASVLIHFYAMEPVAGRFSFSGVCVYAPDAVSDSDHPDWRNSLITREQFDSVDGWVRWISGERPVPAETIIDVEFKTGATSTQTICCIAGEIAWWSYSTITGYRYHKPSHADNNETAEITDPALYFARRSFSWVGCENGFIIPDRVKEAEFTALGDPVIVILAEVDDILQKWDGSIFRAAHIDINIGQAICNHTNQNITAHVIRYLPIDAREVADHE